MLGKAYHSFIDLKNAAINECSIMLAMGLFRL